VTIAAPTVEEVESELRRVSQGVRRAMLVAIPDGEPHRWLYQLVRSYPSRPGKALRPTLCLHSCRAYGGTDEDSFPVAVAIEMLHNAFLVHDDIADGSELRRGRPTLPADYGSALSLNAGDALVVLANQVLRRHMRSFDHEMADRVLDEFDSMALRTLEGQATELGWRREQIVDLTPEDYLDLVLHKTCWYTTIHPLRVGALLGSVEPSVLRAMVSFGFYLGAAFQIRDDLLNLTGAEGVYGKEINGDLYEAKRSLALIHLCGQATGDDRSLLLDYLAVDRNKRTAPMVGEVRRLIDKYGSIDFAADFARGIAGAALEAHQAAYGDAPDQRSSEFLRALVPFMLGRSS
jgi:geranylgeranyl diphosphate synthase, type II